MIKRQNSNYWSIASLFKHQILQTPISFTVQKYAIVFALISIEQPGIVSNTDGIAISHEFEVPSKDRTYFSNDVRD